MPDDRAYPLVNLFGPGGLSRFSTVLYHYLRPGVDREIADFPITPVKSGFTLFRHIIRDTWGMANIVSVSGSSLKRLGS